MSKSTAVTMPQSKDECAAAIAKLALTEKKIENWQTTLSEIIANAAGRIEEQIVPLREQRDALEACIQSFSETRRNELTEGGSRKYHDFTTGRVGWKIGSMKLSYPADKESLIINALIANGLSDCVKKSESVDKAALKKKSRDELKKIEGVSLKRDPESFYIKPADVQIDREADAVGEAT